MAKMTDTDMAQREKIVKSMKKNLKDFRKRYGKRAKEVMYATATKMAMKEEKSEADKGEYDYEGDMAKSQLRSILHNAKMLHDMLEDNTNLPEWVQSKITLAEDYIVTAAQYMNSSVSESHYPTQGSSIEYPKYKEMDMKNIVKDAIGDMPEDDGPHTSNISDADAPNFKTVANPEDVINQPSSSGNVDASTSVAKRNTGKPFKSIRKRMGYGGEDFSGAVASVGIG